MSKIFKPMLAGSAGNAQNLPWPMLASPKLDGIRCIVQEGVARSRRGKPIRNRHIQNSIQKYADVLTGMDGELLVGSPTATDIYHTTYAAVMSIEGEPDFHFYIFDYVLRPNDTFTSRLEMLQTLDLPPFVRILPQTAVNNHAEVTEYEEAVLAEGYEGVMLRHPFAPYKNDRSTAREAYLLKLKRFTDAEAVCIGVGELMHNGNEAFKDELGYTARSTAQAGLVPGGTLGYLLCETPEGIQFKVGTGFSQADRDTLWEHRDELVGKLVKYKFFDIGVKDAPRHPVWLGFRHEDDTDDKPEPSLRPAENSWSHLLNPGEVFEPAPPPTTENDWLHSLKSRKA